MGSSSGSRYFLIVLVFALWREDSTSGAFSFLGQQPSVGLPIGRRRRPYYHDQRNRDCFIRNDIQQRQEESVPLHQLFQSSSGRDETRGAALLLEGVTVYRGPSQILRDIDWRIEPRTKWALVGANGAGKSTLLKAIVGQIPYDGKVAMGTKAANQLGYLQQTAVAGSNCTIYEEAACGMKAIDHARRAMEEAANSGDLNALEKATTRFEALGGYQLEQKVSSVLKGLGFTDFEKRCDELSGGWQMRVSFAKVLLSEPRYVGMRRFLLETLDMDSVRKSLW